MTTPSSNTAPLVWRLVLIIVVTMTATTAYVVYRLADLPADSPLARMYRAEAEIHILAQAVRKYASDHGAYPPPGAGGLARALENAEAARDFFPEGQAVDPWGRPYGYTPHTHYADADGPVFRSNGDFAAPDAFQLFSLGESGAAGLEGEGAQEDVITSWEPNQPWRRIYHQRQQAYLDASE